MSDHISQQRLDELWDFDDSSASERRFRNEIAATEPGSTKAHELSTQLARALGLQQRFVEASALLGTVKTDDPIVLARTLLELGRLLNSAGDAASAIPKFEEALAVAAAEDAEFLEADAAHMLAITDAERAAHWTARALETVDESQDARVKRWGVSLHNNLGVALLNDGKPDAALAEFELAADAARDYGTDQQRIWAQEAIDETLAALGR